MSSPKVEIGRQRRGFFRWILQGMGAVAIAVIVTPIATFLKRARSIGGGGTVKVPLSQLSGDSAIYKDFQGQQVIIFKDKDGTPRVVSAACPHLGCIVRWEHRTRTFLCPCHGAVFGATGAPLKGPTNQPLAPISYKLEEDTIILG